MRLTVTKFAAVAALITLGASSVVSAANIAGEGFAIMGIHTGVLPTNGTPHGQAGNVWNINDGNLSTRVDTWNGNTPTTHSFAGIVWGGARPEAVHSLTITMATFTDGGWFGVNGVSPGAGGALDIAHLTEPSVQILSLGEWITVDHTSDYLAKFTGHVIGGPAANPTVQSATFTLTVPQTDISGIRIIGSEGGTASAGFIGVFELEVEALPVVPEPSAVLLGGLALGALASRRRR